MKYYVTFKIEARYVAEVDAENLEEAMQKAEDSYLNADFGVASDIEGEKIIAEDETGNYVWESD